MCVCVCVCVQVEFTCMHACMRACVCVCMHACICLCLFCVHAHTHTHVWCSQTFLLSASSSSFTKPCCWSLTEMTTPSSSSSSSSASSPSTCPACGLPCSAATASGGGCLGRVEDVPLGHTCQQPHLHVSEKGNWNPQNILLKDIALGPTGPNSQSLLYYKHIQT